MSRADVSPSGLIARAVCVERLPTSSSERWRHWLFSAPMILAGLSSFRFLLPQLLPVGSSPGITDELRRKNREVRKTGSDKRAAAPARTRAGCGDQAGPRLLSSPA